MPTLSTIGAACARAWGFTSGLVKDQYFNLVSLLLPGNGTNGAQNNTFLDSSSNNFTITRNGNTTQGTFSPFSQTWWGAYFDGSNDSVSVVSDASWALSGVFSVEAWVWNGGTQTNYPGIFATPTNGFVLAFKTDTSQFGVAQSGVAWTSVLATPPTANTWTHVAVTRDSSNVMRMFYNGVLKASATVTTSFAQGALTIGAQSGSGSLLGYLSNARWIKGSIPTSYQTSSTTIDASIFTPSTSSLTTSSQGATSGDVKLLALQNNRFIDNSSSPFTLTPNNGAAITPFSPFAPTQSYSAAAVGGSGYFDGTGDYLTAPGNTAFDLGSGDFTIEAWIYKQGSGQKRFIDYANGTATAANFSFAMLVTSSNVAYGEVIIGSTVYGITGTTTVINTWTHVALVRNGTASGNLKLYVNGVAEGTAASLGSNAINTLTGTPYLSISGYYNGAGELFNGYVSSARIIKGTALYTGNFTPSTAPFTAVSGTSLLLNFTNAGVVDATAKNVLETVGNAQISTTQSKWGGGSMRFPQSGTNDYLYRPYDPLLNQLNGNFTIECWIYPTTSGVQQIIAGSLSSGGSANWLFQVTSANKLSFSWINTTPTSFDATSTASISTNTWTYVAAVKNGGTITLYINGSADGTASPTGTYRNASFGFGIGRGGDYNGGYFTGYIDDFRMTIGQARTITASPSAPFALQ